MSSARAAALPISNIRASSHQENALVEIEDGFRPGPSFPTTRVRNTRCGIPGLVLTVDNAIEPQTAAEVYDYTVSQAKPWGIYVTLDELLGDRGAEVSAAHRDSAADIEDRARHSLARRVLSQFFLQRVRFMLERDFSRFHGFALWALGSVVGNEVAYHMDYAELTRLETNVIHPPLYGVTLQLSPIADGEIDGGAFAVNTNGLDHYARFGHKAALQDCTSFEEDLVNSPAWLKVPYRFNRAIVFDGALPHCSTRVVSLPFGMRRVVVGINAVDMMAGPLTCKNAIHSNAFYRAERLRGVLRRLQGEGKSSASKGAEVTETSCTDDGPLAGAEDKFDANGDHTRNTQRPSSSRPEPGGINLRELAKNKDDPTYQFLLKLARAKATAQRREALEATKKRMAIENAAIASGSSFDSST